jgi:hypothetical protein
MAAGEGAGARGAHDRIPCNVMDQTIAMYLSGAMAAVGGIPARRRCAPAGPGPRPIVQLASWPTEPSGAPRLGGCGGAEVVEAARRPGLSPAGNGRLPGRQIPCHVMDQTIAMYLSGARCAKDRDPGRGSVRRCFLAVSAAAPAGRGGRPKNPSLVAAGDAPGNKHTPPYVKSPWMLGILPILCTLPTASAALTCPMPNPRRPTGRRARESAVYRAGGSAAARAARRAPRARG